MTLAWGLRKDRRSLCQGSESLASFLLRGFQGKLNGELAALCGITFQFKHTTVRLNDIASDGQPRPSP